MDYEKQESVEYISEYHALRCNQTWLYLQELRRPYFRRPVQGENRTVHVDILKSISRLPQ